METVEHSLERIKHETISTRDKVAREVFDMLKEKGHTLDLSAYKGAFTWGVYCKAALIRSEYKPFNDRMKIISRCYSNIAEVEAALVAVRSGRDADFFNFAVKNLCYKRREMGG